jgi:hypothetical protein
MQEEKFAMNIRSAGSLIRSAEQDIAKSEAVEKMLYAKAMVRAEAQGQKTAAAQMRCADLEDEVYQARVNRGVAKGALAAAKAEFMACEIEFEQWRSEKASNRMERKAYNA